MQKKDALRKYYYSPKGRAQADRKRGKPAYKVWFANYRDAHKDVRNEKERNARKKKWEVTRIVTCGTWKCAGSWTLTPKNGNRRLCDDCRVLARQYGIQKSVSRRRKRLLKAA